MTAISQAAIKRVVADIPDAMRPSWLEQTWSGGHGAGGLRAQVDDVSSRLELTPNGMSGTSTADGQVKLGSSNVGEFTRDQTLHESGRLEVHHSYLKLDSSMQGTGFARSFNDQAFARYAEAGVDDVTIDAALSMGGYAWARQGFELIGKGSDEIARATSRAEKLTGLVDRARGNIDDAAYAALEPRLYRGGQLRADTLTSVQELAALPVGRSVLVGNYWSGIRPIERANTWWAGRTPGGVEDIQRGVSHLLKPTDTSAAAGQASRRIAANLPPALDPSSLGRAFERTLRNVGGGATLDGERGARTLIRLERGDALDELSSSAALTTMDGQSIVLETRLARDGTVRGEEYLPSKLDDVGTRRALNAAWRELGVTDVQRNRA
ncbi:MAG: hypothetical protein JWM90_1696 [Thermoleophilia bacterium]|nr:hypothetical protein [Thermoleophilia bacterium]